MSSGLNVNDVRAKIIDGQLLTLPAPANVSLNRSGPWVASSVEPVRAMGLTTDCGARQPGSTVVDPNSRAGSVAVAAAACLWGGWGLLLRTAGLSGATSACLALFSIGVLGIPLLPRRIPRDRRVWIALAAIGFFDAGNTVLFFEALERGPIGTAVLSHYLAPVLVAILSPLALGVRPRRVTVVALPVALLGLALLVGGEVLHLGRPLVTMLFGAGSAVFYALNVVVSKRVSDRLTPAELLVYHALISALLLLPLALMAPPPSLGSAAIVVGGAIVSGIGGGLLFLWGLARIPAHRASTLTYLEPVVGVFLGLLVLGEAMAPAAPLGAALIIGAGILVVRHAG